MTAYPQFTHIDLENIAKYLDKSSRNGQGWLSCCPAHDDHNPSLSLSIGGNGNLLLHCFAGCDFDSIWNSLKQRGLAPNQHNSPATYIQHHSKKPDHLKVVKDNKDTLKVILPVPDDAPPFNEAVYGYNNKKFGGNPSAIYPYHNAEGKIMGYMVRWDNVLQDDGSTKKETRPYVYVENEKGYKQWFSMGLPHPLPLYNLHEIVKRGGDPVLIIEGEKAAEAGKILLPDYISITTLFGAKSCNKTDFSHLNGRDIIICPDFDEAGQKYGDMVCGLAKEAGAKSIRYLPIEIVARELLGISNIDKGYDIADAAEDGLLEVFKQGESIDRFIVPYLTKLEREAVFFPDGFRFDDKGNVQYLKIEKNQETGEWEEVWKFLCSYMVVTHLMRDGKSDEWSRILKMIDKDGVQKEFMMPMSMLAGDGNVLKEKLLSLGVLINFGATHHLKSYISMSSPRARARSFNKTGWDDNCYILSEDKIYSPKGDDSKKKERLIFNIPGRSSVYEKKGTLENWKQTIGKYAIGNSRLQFALFASLAAPLLNFLDEDNFGIHYFGSSSIGKTISLQVANSVWGKKIHTWRTTDNALESLARSSNDGLLILDEISQVNGDAADAIAYMLGNGQGKARSNKKGEARAIAEFNLIFFSSGEVGLESKLMESRAGKRLKAGQTVRFIEIPADAGKGYGVFENLHGFETSQQFANALKDLCTQHKGTLIDSWIHFITQNKEEIVLQIKTRMKSWIHENELNKVDGQVDRVRRKIAFLAAVGEVAIHHGFLPFAVGDASTVCIKMLNIWIGQRGGVDSHEVMAVVDRLIRFMETHGSSRFEHIESKIEKEMWQEVSQRRNDNTYGVQERVKTLKNTVTHNRVGFRVWASISEEGKENFLKAASNGDDQSIEGIIWQYYFLPEAFEQEILQGGDKKILLHTLADKKLIDVYVEKVKDGKDIIRYIQSVRLTGYPLQRLYKISNNNSFEGKS